MTGALTLLALAATVFVAVVMVAPSAADSKATRVLVLGNGSQGITPDPGKVEGRVTGYQSLTSTVARPYQAPYEGKLVAWSLRMSKPNADTRRFFYDLFHGGPSARISVLKKVRGNGSGTRLKLVRQGPIQDLKVHLGTYTQFALDHPLTVLKGQIVALTIPTWAPVFGSGLTGNNTWKASRKSGACNYPATGTPDQQQAYVDNSHPQQKVRSTKNYGCYYGTSRLLYTATLVKK